MHIQYYVLVHPPRTRNCTETESLTHSLLYVSVPFLRLLFRRTCWAVGRGRRHRCRRLFDSLHGHAPNPNISSLTPCMICTVLVNEGNMICVLSRALISKSIRVDHSDTVIQVCETACTSNTACMSLSLSGRLPFASASSESASALASASASASQYRHCLQPSALI